MVLINKGEANTVIMTLTERVTISNPYFLFVFRLRQSPSNEVKLLAANESTVTVRYDKFTITDTATPNALNGEGNFTITGEWEYIVYQVATATLTIPSDSNILERGIAKVVGDESTIAAYNNTLNVTVYE